MGEGAQASRLWPSLPSTPLFPNQHIVIWREVKLLPLRGNGAIKKGLEVSVLASRQWDITPPPLLPRPHLFSLILSGIY